MRLILGLGNPGPRYERTRHNVGWTVIDAFASRFRIQLDTHEKDAMTGRGRVAGQSVLLAKPLTYMNLSGTSAAKLVRSYGIETSEMLVVYDDIDLPLGRLRFRERGSAGTHNGMRSIIAELGTEAFPRLRVGISGEGRENSRDLAQYVLEDFTAGEQSVVAETITRSLDGLLMFCRGDLRNAMNKLNRDPSPSPDAGDPVEA